MVRAINHKLLRDLWLMRGQALAIAMVIGSGVATFIMSLSTLDSLQFSRTTYYQDYHFAHAFASLKRAPEDLRSRLADIPGVQLLETRVVAAVNVDIPGFNEPVKGQLFSIPDAGQPLLNQLYLRQGRLPEPERDDEVVISDSFAEAHKLVPGDHLAAIINGRRKALTIAGIALTPEHVYQANPNSIFPDYKRFGIFWMARTPLGIAYDMDGAFNDATMTLTADAQLDDVIDRLDNLLEPYGGLGAYGREDQISHYYLSQEFEQLKQMATLFPVIFLGVAAFLLNVVVSRLVSTQREQIAALKAFGYSNMAIGLHYIQLVMLIVLLGTATGVGAGAWLGVNLSELYIEHYRLPFLYYELNLRLILAAALVSTVAAAIGTVFAVRTAVSLPPAEAMRPEPPAKYRESIVERIGLQRVLHQPSRMIIRHLERRPLKAILSITGIAFAYAILIVGRLFGDSIDAMVDIEFTLAQREDMVVSFVEPTSRKAMHEMRSMRGVEYAEAFRAVPVRLNYEHRSYRTAIQGVQPAGELRRLLDDQQRQIRLPPAGIVLTDYLGEILGVRPGDRLTVEVLEGSRPVREVTVAGFVNQFIGVSAYMQLDALNRMMREGHAISGVYLAADERYQAEIYTRLKDTPRVAGTEASQLAIQNFYDAMGEQVLIFVFFNTILAGTIAFGVVYNSARIALSERSRELASMRVLGFTRGEISYILLGELAVLTLAAIPLGFIIGRVLGLYMMSTIPTELIRLPFVIDADTYAFAMLVVILSAVISALAIKHKLNRLDLIAVLKTKE